MSVEAFELVSVIERLVQPPSKTQVGVARVAVYWAVTWLQISCIDSWDQRLYIGTSDGSACNHHSTGCLTPPCRFVVMYQLETAGAVHAAYRCTLRTRQRLTSGKPVEHIQVRPHQQSTHRRWSVMLKCRRRCLL